MTSAATTPDEFEIQALEVRLLTKKARRVMDGTRYHVRALWYGARLASALPGFVTRLRRASAAGEFDQMEDAEFDAFVDQLQDVYRILCNALEFASRYRLDRQKMHRNLYATIERNTVLLGDVLESFRLSQDEEFGRTMKEAVGTL